MSKRDSKLTHKEVQRLFLYSETTGLLVRRTTCGRSKVGTHSTAKDKDGYLVVGIAGRLYRTHRVIWFYVHGSWPDVCDHKNRVKDDNRLSNLRDVTRSQNKQNQLVCRTNKLGIKGVWLHKQNGTYCASIGHQNKNIYIGSFATVEEASDAYKAMAGAIHQYNPVV